MAKPAHWLVKSEPSSYSFAKLVTDGETRWDGVRNYTARNNLRAMHTGDLVLFYHSNDGKEIVGIAKVVREAYADPTSDADWSVVDLAPVCPLAKPVALDTIRAHDVLGQMAMIRLNRLSVTPVTPDEFAVVLKLAGTRLPH